MHEENGQVFQTKVFNFLRHLRACSLISIEYKSSILPKLIVELKACHRRPYSLSWLIDHVMFWMRSSVSRS